MASDDDDLSWRCNECDASRREPLPIPMPTISVRAAVGLLEFTIYIGHPDDPEQDACYEIEGFLDDADMEARRPSNHVTVGREDFLAALQLARVREHEQNAQ